LVTVVGLGHAAPARVVYVAPDGAETVVALATT
jgi:hypothetical protein